MARYEINGQVYEVPDDVQGQQLVETLTMLSEQTAAPDVPPPLPGEIPSVSSIPDPATPRQDEQAADLGIAGNLQRAISGERLTPEQLQQPVSREPGMVRDALANIGLEAMAAVNRGATGIADFAASLPNAVAQLSGRQEQIPSLTEAASPGTAGGFMEPGLARDVVRGGGELAAPGALAGAGFRAAAQQLPRFGRAGESVLSGTIRQLGQSTPTQDVAFSALSGGGAVLGGAGGEAIAGQEGRQIGELAGGILAPLAGGIAAQQVGRIGMAPRGAEVEVPLRASADEAPVDEFARSTSARADIAEPPTPGPVTPEQAARNLQREEAFTRLGATPTEAQRTRDRGLFVQQQDLFKQGGRVTEALERQEEVFAQRAREALEATGGDAFQAPSSPIETVVSRSLRADKRIGDLYREAREAAPDAKNVRFNNAASVLRQFAPDDQLSGGVISSLRGSLEQSGALTGFRPSGRVSIDAAERIRQTANDIFPSTNSRGRTIIRQFKEALDEDVGRAAGEDFFKEARAAKAAFEKGLDRERFNKFDERDVNIVRDILTNRITPDDIQQGTLFRAGSRYKAQDLKELQRYLTAPEGEEGLAGLKAWDDIRAAAMENVISTAFRGPLTERGTQSLSRAGIERAIKSMGREKFNVLFNEPERKFLADLAEVAAFKEPVPGAQLGSGPSGQAIQNAADRLDEKLDRILGFRVPLVSSALGAAQTRRAERQILQLTDDLADIEKAQIKESIRRARKYDGALGTTVGVADVLLPDQQGQGQQTPVENQSRTAAQVQ